MPIHNCKEARNHNAIFVKEQGKINIYSKFYILYDKSEDQPADEDWYMDLRMRDVSYCPYCGAKL